MTSSAKDITSILDGESSLGLVYGTDLFSFRIPADPQNCVTVIDRAGDPNLMTLKDENHNAYYYCGIVIYVRNVDYKNGFEQALAINQYLNGISNTTINDTFYSFTKAIGEPRLLHWDGNDRAVFTININIQRRYSS